MKNATRLLLFLFSLLPALAAANQMTTDSLAQAAGNGQSGAMSMAIKLFGNVMLHPLDFVSADGGSTLGLLFGVINGSLMAVATVWVSYSLVSGVLITAHEGRFLGQMSKAVPVRLVAGIGSLVPVFKGFCLAQVIMLWAIQMGIGMGNLVWQAAVDHVDAGNALIAGSPIRSTDLALQVFKSNLCVEAQNAGAALVNLKGNYDVAATPAGYAYGHVSYAGESSPHAVECGSFALPTVVNRKDNGLSAGIASALVNQAEAAATAAHADAFKALDAATRAIARKYVGDMVHYQVANATGTPTPMPLLAISELDQATSDYRTNLQNKILSVQRGLNGNTTAGNFISALKQDATQNGFINAGAWYMTLGTSNSIAQDAMSKSVTQQSAPMPAEYFYPNTFFRFVMSRATVDFSSSQNSATRAASVSNASGGNESLFFRELQKGACSAADLGASFSVGQCIVNKFANAQNAPAIVRIADLGNIITGLGAAVITASGAAQGFKSGVVGTSLQSVASVATFGASDAVVGGMSIWLDIAKTVAQALLFWGVFASVWIPMIPAVIWIGGVASLLAVWVEAVVAAPIWAFAHMDTAGEGVGQRAQTGYLFLLNVLFRPSLMVVGFVLGAIMVDILTDYAMALYPTILANANVDSWTGLIKICAYISAFVIILQMIVSLSFSMIRFVPDQVLGWIGGNSTNEVGAQTESTTGGGAKSAFVARGGKGGGGKAKQAGAAKQDKPGSGEDAAEVVTKPLTQAGGAK